MPAMTGEREQMSRKTDAAKGDCAPLTEDGRLWLAPAALSVVAFILLAWPAFAGRVYVADDLSTQHLPLRAFYMDCLRNGDSFLWCPGLFCGYYVHAEGQTGMTHPLHWCLYRFLRLGVAFNIEFLHTYPMALLGMFFLLRRHKMSLSASLYGGFAFAFSTYMMWHYIHMHVVAIMAHTPWLLLCVNVAMRSSGGARAAGLCGLALLTASQLLLGHPQHVWFSSLAEVVYALGLARADGTLARLALPAAFKGLGVLAAAIQWIPSRDALADSVRAAPTAAFLYRGSLDPEHLLQIVAPWAFRGSVLDFDPEASPGEYAVYAGALIPLLIVWLFMRRKDLGALRPLAIGAGVFGAVALVLAMGRYGGLYLVQQQLPVVGLFRMPSRYLVLVHLACAVLAAIAFVDLQRVVRDKALPPLRSLWPLWIPLALSVLTTTAILLWQRLGPPESFIAQQTASLPLLALGPLLFGAATLLFLLCLGGHRWALVALMVFGAAELAAYDFALVFRTPTMTVRGILTFRLPPSDLEHRIYMEHPAGNRLIARNLRLADGYVGLAPRQDLDYTLPQSQQVAEVRWVTAQAGTAIRWSPAKELPLPRARLLCRADVSANPREDIAHIDPAQVALVDAPVSLSPGPQGQADITLDRPGHIRIAVRAPSRQILCLSESYNRGWRMTVDGAPAGIVRTYGDFMGCVVPEGAHAVEFVFAPPSFATGRAVSLAALALLAIATAFVALRDRPRNRPPSGQSSG